MINISETIDAASRLETSHRFYRGLTNCFCRLKDEADKPQLDNTYFFKSGFLNIHTHIIEHRFTCDRSRMRSWDEERKLPEEKSRKMEGDGGGCSSRIADSWLSFFSQTSAPFQSRLQTVQRGIMIGTAAAKQGAPARLVQRSLARSRHAGVAGGGSPPPSAPPPPLPLSDPTVPLPHPPRVPRLNS